MTKFCYFTLASMPSRRVLLNPAYIVAMVPASPGSVITTVTGDKVHVTETTESFAEAFARAEHNPEMN